MQSAVFVQVGVDEIFFRCFASGIVGTWRYASVIPVSHTLGFTDPSCHPSLIHRELNVQERRE